MFERTSAAIVSREIRRILKEGGSPEHAMGVQWFFQEEIKSHGWYTAPLRRETIRQRRLILQQHSLDFLVEVANQLFSGKVLEAHNFAVYLLETFTEEFGDAEFKLLESWLPRISS